ncbi:hypothetical protein NM688_g272 [Phlebia brevispora]|uniref:Uncharacterized protein n=1 Tax=Phlebia brevispora TaxID=194682 RepID=A0ACC1TFJ9_9APHY|nr:hypothetical protein NM688_g272 [Phlebia brevispora]
MSLNLLAIFLYKHELKLSDLIIEILTTPEYKNLARDLLVHEELILSALLQHSESLALGWLQKNYVDSLIKEVQELTRKETGWHFAAARANADQIDEFHIEEMAQQMGSVAPFIWSLLESLLSANEKPKKRGHSDGRKGSGEDAAASVSTAKGGSGSVHPKIHENTGAEEHRRTVVSIRKVSILSTIMLTANQHCNALASIIGLFCHANKTPEKVIETLSRVGITISQNAIHEAIRSLSRESQEKIASLGQTLTVAYAYDNFDVDLKHSVPTLEKLGDTLQHLTSGLLFPIDHLVSADELKCSAYLRQKSRLDDTSDKPSSQLSPPPDWRNLFKIHPEHNTIDGDTGMTARDRWNAWKILQILLYHGPAYFEAFRKSLKDPETIEPIPLNHTPLTPARAMEINNGTVAGNKDALKALLAQGSVGDPHDVQEGGGADVADVSDHVVLFHGDLGSGEKIHSAQLRAILEKTPLHRLQFAIFVFRLFHMKMAAVDALWRIFIKPKSAREDHSSPMRHAAILRPRETGIILSKPGFRRMHQLIQHDCTCQILECWRAAAMKLHSDVRTLDDYAAKKPTFEQLKDLADHIALNYVARQSHFGDLRERPEDQRDKQFENALLANQYYLLYEETCYAMNAGDIGQVELTFAPWACIFKATGKHKYATQVVKHTTDVHFFFPEGLKKAVRYSMLVNPTGKPHCFRPVDWCVERNNLDTKTVHGGDGSNHTVDRILAESPLIGTYKTIYETIETNFHLTHLTTRHGNPVMTSTFQMLSRYIQEDSPYIPKAGRGSAYSIPDIFDQGLLQLMTGMGAENEDVADAEAADAEAHPEEEDLQEDL